ncbi:hypothetical protein HF086_009182 [Spodoptera exigua]|uniref:Peptidase S1 domain-containing protein n=1 Tax=Spodoptera exigua TaxID=7107 RepID=A0A922MXF7_SPOEX|nr:hypothetical protein HF086_009182 [Spodoptera exigua]
MGQLRHVKLMKVNIEVCKRLYDEANYVLPTDYMICLGWPTGDRSQYYGDSGSPIFHNGVVVGVCSAGVIGLPDINIRVANFTNWIVENS